MQLPYYLKILEIPPPSKYRRMVQGWKLCMHYKCIQIGVLLKLCTHVHVDLCRHCPRIVTAWYSVLKLNLAIDNREDGLETLYKYMGTYSSQSCDFIKVYELHGFATPAKAVFVALEKDLLHI